MFDKTLLWPVLRRIDALRRLAPVLAEILRKLVLLVWWTATCQLHIHLRFWLAARRRRAHPPEPVSGLIDRVDPDRLTIRSSAGLVISADPVITVVIPVHGQIDFTLRCLASIAAHPPLASFEVLVFDDAGPAADNAVLARVRGIVLVRAAANLGFIGACNAAAQAAKGRYLLFLNNDTQVLPEWADTMLSLFQTRPDAGAVGAKLLFPDGSLQEAGGIVWRDGTGWNAGRHDDPALPEHNYVREVDYCSGAALMVPADIFRACGGFDTRYAPAYFEDTDLSFQLRRAGLKTYYQPRARVVHHEGASHGQDVTTGVKSCQVVNRRTFVQVWRDALTRDHYCNGEHVLRARDRARHRKVVLVIDHLVPRPDRDAGSRSMVAFLRALLAADCVVKFWPHNLLATPGYTEALQDMGIEVFHGPNHPSLTAWLQRFGSEIDHVLLSRPDVAQDCLPAVRRHTDAHVSYYGHDLHFMRLRAQGEAERNETVLRAADRMEERERAIWKAVDAVLYPSGEEAAIVRLLEPGVDAVAVQPYAFDQFAAPASPPAGQDILFVAGFGHPPNEQALRWYLEEVHPLVRHRLPGARLRVAGSEPSAWVLGQACGHIHIEANLSDAMLAGRYAASRVAIVPLMHGAGVKLKTVEALRWGLPLVTTPVGAQGLPDLGTIVPVRRDPIGFAGEICALLIDDRLWTTARAAQIAYARTHFNTAGLSGSLLRGMGLTEPRQVVLAAE